MGQLPQAWDVPEPGSTRVGKARRSRAVGILVVVWLVLAIGSAIVLANVQRDSREKLASNFRLRAETAARFVETYVGELFAQEHRVATDELSGDNVTREDFDRALNLVNAEAAVLLDDRGRALWVAPHDPAATGADLGAEYEHLGSAVNGEPAASNVVPSAVEGTPVVAFAVPFGTPSGRRVFSGAYDVRETPFAVYLREAAVTAPNHVYLTDAAGDLFASSAGSAPEEGDEGSYVVTRRIEGTPWSLAITTPESFLYSTVDGSERLVPWLFWGGAVIGGLLSVLLVARLLRRRQTLMELNVTLDRLANADPLTELPNRRRIEDELDRAVATSNRYGTPLSLLLVDLDHFKQINDSRGHAVGDAVLKAVAHELAVTLRNVDVPGRWGGDEFVVLLPHIKADGARIVAARLVERVRAASPAVGGGIELSVSIGGAEAAGEGAEALLHRADTALYEAKSRGRDQFVVAAGDSVAVPA